MNLTEYHPDSPRTALVTGGTGSLGSPLVKHLGDKGWNIAFQYFSNDKIASDHVQKRDQMKSKINSIESQILEISLQKKKEKELEELAQMQKNKI